MVGTCRSHIWPHKRPLSSLTFWLVLDQLFHLALFQCVYHIRQAALASLRGSEGAHGRAAVAAGPSPTSAFLFAWWGSVVLGIRTQGAPLAILLLEKGRRGKIIRFKDYLTLKTEKIKCEGEKVRRRWGRSWHRPTQYPYPFSFYSLHLSLWELIATNCHPQPDFSS